MPEISQLMAREILDSRGRPTLSATCVLASGAAAEASVPAGASKGSREAAELRDHDPNRYGGLGCLKAVANVTGPVAAALTGQELEDQAALDGALIDLDGTADKSRLGANTVLAVSVAFARATALDRGLPLYRHFAAVIGEPLRQLPCLSINLFSGGKHAGEQVTIQDVLVVPLSTDSAAASLAMMYDIYSAAADITLHRYGMRKLTADEGGLAPPFGSAEEMLETATDAIQGGGLAPGIDAALAIDVAASHFFANGSYRLDGQDLTPVGMIERISEWVDEWPIVSVEDGLADEDWNHWPTLARTLDDRALLLGDDLLCTNPRLVQRAIDDEACNALLLKLNQIGTVTEAAQAYRLARSAGWRVSVSVRSGETEDHWAADLAVGWGADFFKAGSITQSERLAKYNRLLAIEAEAHLPRAGCVN